MTLTEEVLQILCQYGDGEPFPIIDTGKLGGILHLTVEELHSALQALEVTGLVWYGSAAAGTTRVQLTAHGAEQCGRHA